MNSYGVVYFVDKYSPSPNYPFNSWDTASHSIADILNIADEYSIIKIAPGEYVEDITLENISGITIIGSGSGTWNGNSYHGGTIIKGAFRWNDSAKNIKMESLAFTPNNPNHSKSYNLSFFGQSDNIEFNSFLYDIAFYGDSFCVHNTEFRGKKWNVEKVRSFNAGIHNFPIKAGYSIFKDIYVENNNVNASFIIIKSHHPLGSPDNLIIDGFHIKMTGYTFYPGIFFVNYDSPDQTIENVVIKNGYIKNLTTNNFPCIRFLGDNYNNNYFRDIIIENTIFDGGECGIMIQNGYYNTNNKGLDKLYVNNCTFINPSGRNEYKVAINNNVGNENDPGSNIYLTNINAKDFPNDQIFKNIDRTEVRSSFYSGINNDNIILNWTTILGYKYQIQSSGDLINWYNIGEEIIGTGSNLTWGNYIFESQKYYRVIEKYN